VKSVSLPDKHL